MQLHASSNRATSVIGWELRSSILNHCDDVVAMSGLVTVQMHARKQDEHMLFGLTLLLLWHGLVDGCSCCVGSHLCNGLQIECQSVWKLSS